MAGLADELMEPLSIGGVALTFATQVGHSNVAQWVDGARTAMFDALLKDGPSFDEPDSPWRDRMREAGDDPDGEGPMPDGLFHTGGLHSNDRQPHWNRSDARAVAQRTVSGRRLPQIVEGSAEYSRLLRDAEG